MLRLPKVSIIMPVYNADKWLHRCVDSILIQTFVDFELLLVNDGSKDNSGAICEEYAKKDSRVRVLHKENGGVSSARNLGIDNARGEWITFCDADDYVMPNWLESYDLSSNSDKDIICQGIVYIQSQADASEAKIDKKVCFDGNMPDLVSALMNKNLFGYVFNKVYRKDILNSENSTPIRFNPTLAFMEDEDFNYRYLLLCKRGIINSDGTYCYVLPDTNKYDMYSDEKIPLYEYFINLSRQLCGGKRLDIEMKYHHLITTSFVFTCKDNHYMKSCLQKFRKYILKEFRCCPLFAPTKLCIGMDPTGIFSGMALRLHMKLKRHD